MCCSPAFSEGECSPAFSEGKARPFLRGKAPARPTLTSPPLTSQAVRVVSPPDLARLRADLQAVLDRGITRFGRGEGRGVRGEHGESSLPQQHPAKGVFPTDSK